MSLQETRWFWLNKSGTTVQRLVGSQKLWLSLPERSLIIIATGCEDWLLRCDACSPARRRVHVPTFCVQISPPPPPPRERERLNRRATALDSSRWSLHSTHLHTFQYIFSLARNFSHVNTARALLFTNSAWHEARWKASRARRVWIKCVLGKKYYAPKWPALVWRVQPAVMRILLECE